MNTPQTAWLALLAAAMLANLPFLRLVRSRRLAPHWLDFAGWLLAYAAWMGVSTLLESTIGKVAARDWEVWAVSLAMFAVLAFPGIVWRHLLASKATTVKRYDA